MITFRFEGIEKLKRDTQKLAKALSKETDREMGRQAGKVEEFAKTKRFRFVASPNKRINGKLASPPIRGILTMRSSFYRNRIGPPRRLGRSRWQVTARVPYAVTHEDDRPVLTAALKARRDAIEKAVGLKINETIHREGWR